MRSASAGSIRSILCSARARLCSVGTWFGPKPIASIEAKDGVFGPPEMHQHRGALHRAIPIVRREPVELSQGKERFVEPLLFDQKGGEISPGLRRLRLQLHRLVERFQCLLVPSLAAQDRAEARQILRLGHLPNCAGEPFQREVILGGLKRQESHQVHRIGVMGIDGERLPAAKLCVQRALGLEMPESGRAQRGGIFGIAGGRRGFSGSPAFVTIHGALFEGEAP